MVFTHQLSDEACDRGAAFKIMLSSWFLSDSVIKMLPLEAAVKFPSCSTDFLNITSKHQPNLYYFVRINLIAVYPK